MGGIMSKDVKQTRLTGALRHPRLQLEISIQSGLL